MEQDTTYLPPSLQAIRALNECSFPLGWHTVNLSSQQTVVSPVELTFTHHHHIPSKKKCIKVSSQTIHLFVLWVCFLSAAPCEINKNCIATPWSKITVSRLNWLILSIRQLTPSTVTHSLVHFIKFDLTGWLGGEEKTERAAMEAVRKNLLPRDIKNKYRERYQ